MRYKIYRRYGKFFVRDTYTGFTIMGKEDKNFSTGDNSKRWQFFKKVIAGLKIIEALSNIERELKPWAK